MRFVWLGLGWFFAALFALLLASMVLIRNWAAAVVLLGLILLTLPPLASEPWGWTISPLARAGLIVVGVIVFGKLLIGGQPTSIYASPDVRDRFVEIYDEKMARWPVPYEDLFMETRYGQVHVIASGPDDAPPLLLLHASGVSSWSWHYNVAALSRDRRTYAIDLIGDAGKSEYRSLDTVMRTGRHQADLYAEIMDGLGVEHAPVVGASEGGFIASNLALHHPERVDRLVLLGPMGYAGATRSIVRITLAQLFPVAPVQRSTFRWAFGDQGSFNSDVEEWFLLIMNGLRPVKVAPLPLQAEERQAVRAPVLFVFGTRDNLVGDPAAAAELVRNMADVRVEVVEAGHLMAAEQPDRVNRLIREFLDDAD